MSTALFYGGSDIWQEPWRIYSTLKLKYKQTRVATLFTATLASVLFYVIIIGLFSRSVLCFQSKCMFISFWAKETWVCQSNYWYYFWCVCCCNDKILVGNNYIIITWDNWQWYHKSFFIFNIIGRSAGKAPGWLLIEV